MIIPLIICISKIKTLFIVSLHEITLKELSLQVIKNIKENYHEKSN